MRTAFAVCCGEYRSVCDPMLSFFRKDLKARVQSVESVVFELKS